MALALADPATTWAERIAISGLSLLLGGWYWLWVVRRRIWTLPILQVLAYFAGAAALWLLLVSMNEAFFLIAFSAYQQVFSYLPSRRSAIPGVVVLTGLLLAMEFLDAGRPSPLSLLIALLSVGLCILGALWVDAIMRQSQDRHRLIEELEATRAELAAAERQAGTLGERQRLAQEIHDTLAQGLTSVVTLLEATEAELAPGQAAARRHLAHALRTARDTLAEVRRFVWALQPRGARPRLAGGGIGTACRDPGRRDGHDGSVPGYRCPRNPCPRRRRSPCCAPPRKARPTSESMPEQRRPFSRFPIWTTG